MTVAEQTPQNTYTATGATNTFAFTFRILSDEDIVVTLNEIQQIKDTDYTVENVTQAGGDIVFTVTPANGDEIVIARVTPRDQQIDYQPFDPFPAETHELALDKLTMITQEIVAGTGGGGGGGFDPGANYNITGSWTYLGAQNFTGPFLLDSVEVTVSATILNDTLRRGAAETITGQWDFNNPDMVIDLIRARDLVDQTSGASITGNWSFDNADIGCRDRRGLSHTLGWRDPARFAKGNSDHTVEQDWEGSCVDMTPTVPRTITIPEGITPFTTFRVFNNGDNVNINFVPATNVNLFLYDGGGVRQGSGSFFLPGGGVAELYSPADDIWRIFGSGIGAV